MTIAGVEEAAVKPAVEQEPEQVLHSGLGVQTSVAGVESAEMPDAACVEVQRLSLGAQLLEDFVMHAWHSVHIR